MTSIRTIYVCFYNELLCNDHPLLDMESFSTLMGRDPTMQAKDQSRWNRSRPLPSTLGMETRTWKVLGPESTAGCVDPRERLHRPVDYCPSEEASGPIAFRVVLHWDCEEDLARLFVLRMRDTNKNALWTLMRPVLPTITVYQKLWDSGDSLNAIEMETLAFVARTLLTSRTPFENPIVMTLIVRLEGGSPCNARLLIPGSPEELDAFEGLRVMRSFL